MDLWKQRLAFFVAGAAVIGGLWSFCGAVETERGPAGIARTQDAAQDAAPDAPQGENAHEPQDGPRTED